MLISKRSRRRSSAFDSKFRQGTGVEFPLRQYLRAREEVISVAVQAGLLLAFVVTLIVFGKTLNALFQHHGENLNPAFRWLALGALFVFILSVCRRIYYKVVDIKEIRREMAHLKEQFRHRET